MVDFDHAIAAHAAWKARLRAYIAGEGERVTEAEVRRDDACELGQWLLREAATLGGDPAYATVKAEHARFHAVAADVVRHVDAGEHAAAERALAIGSSFSAASAALVHALVELRARHDLGK